MKRIYLLILVGLAGVAAGFYSPKADTQSQAYEYGNGILAEANWASQAAKLDELYAEADLVVRARVNHQEHRVTQYNLPAYEVEDFPQDEVLENYTYHQVGERELNVAYTDSALNVLEVYKGSAGSTITVMQLGGELPLGDGESTTPISLADDPIYSQGVEVLLFLVDISGDQIHAPDRELYRVVNPAGRYNIYGERVVTLADPEMLAYRGVTLPSTLAELETQLQQLK